LISERVFWGCDSEPVLSRWAESKDVADLCVNVAASNTTMTRVLDLIVGNAVDWRFWMMHRIIEEQTAAAVQTEELLPQQPETLWNSPKRVLLATTLYQNETLFNK